MRTRLTATYIVLDAVMILLAGVFATWLRFGSLDAPIAFEGVDSQITFLGLTVAIVPLWVLLMAFEGLYKPRSASVRPSELARIARALSFGVIAYITLTYALRLPGLSRGWTLLMWSLSILFVVFGRSAVHSWIASQRRRGHLLRRTLIVGSNPEAADVIRVLKASPQAGHAPIGCLASSQADRLSLDFCEPEVPCLGVARDLPRLTEEHDVEAVIIASSAFDHDVLARMINELRGTNVEIDISSGLFEVITSRVLVREIGGVPVISVRGVSLSGASLLTKRTFDIVVSLAIVIVGLPIWLAVAAAIKLTSPGPVFFKQVRVGRQGEAFGMYKYRSMYVDAEQRLDQLKSENESTGPLFKMKNDPRITPVGKWLRRLSIDEFPQLLNVLRGEMSLVGPRPPLPREVEQYTPHDWRRLELTPGMTGLWQVSGRSSLTFDEMVRLDLLYIENWSVALDLSLLARTIPAVLASRGAY